MNIKRYYINYFLLFFSIFFVTNSFFSISIANAEIANNLSSSIDKGLKKISRNKQTKYNIEIFLRQLPKGITPADYFNQHEKSLIVLAENHAYPTLIAINKLGVDLKKIDQKSKGELSNIIKRNASVDTVYGQGGEIAQLENILGLRQYTERELDRANYENSIFQINIGTSGGGGLSKGSAVWKERRESLSWEEQKKYLQWMGGLRTSYVHLRPDGVVGITGLEKNNNNRSMGLFDYTTGVTWQMEGKDLIINWYDNIKFSFKYDASNDRIYAKSSVKGWTGSISPSWGLSNKRNNNNIWVVSKVAKGESVALEQKKPSVEKKVVAIQKTSTMIKKEQLSGVWVVEAPSADGALSMLEFRPGGLLLPWKRLKERNINLPFLLFPKNDKPQYVFGTILTVPKSNGNYTEAPFSPAFNMIFNWPHKNDLGFDDWQLMDNNILRLSRRFYQAKINNGQLVLQPYAICPIRIKTAHECIEKKIIAKSDKRSLKSWTFRPLDNKQREEFNIYTTVEFLKYLPASKDKGTKFKLRTIAKLPNYVSLLKSNQHLAEKKIPDMLIISSVIPTWRGPGNATEYRTADDLRLAFQLGFGRWLRNVQYNGEPVCETYIKLLSKQSLDFIQKDSKKVLQDYCDSKSEVFKSTESGYKATTTVAKKPAFKSINVKKTPANNFAGCWNWSNGAYVIINADGTARTGPFVATWKTVDVASGHYTITWPPFVDTLAMSADGSALSGTNNFGFPVSAARKSAQTLDVVGRWLWSSGVTMDIRSDSSISGGAFRGTWSKAGNNWVFEWPLVDVVSLAADGHSLITKNQFGPATAKHDASCKGK